MKKKDIRNTFPFLILENNGFKHWKVELKLQIVKQKLF